MKNVFLVILLLVFVIGCKTNRKHNGFRQGKWITYDSINGDYYKYIEKYKNDEEVKTWKTFKNKKLYKKEIHIRNISYITYYNEAKKVVVRGQSKYEKNSKLIHWFYFGDWNYYNQNGELILTRKYENGEIQSEIEIK